MKADEFGKHLSDLTAFKAAEDVRRGSLPQKPEDFQYALPKDFQIPQGIEFKFNEGDANLQAARVAAKEMGLNQDQFSRLLGLYAGARVNEIQAIKTAREAEITKLGPTGAARMSAINTFLNGFLGEADAKPLQDSIWTASAAQAWEKLITKLASGHGSTFSHSHRDGSPQKVDDATYDAWSPAQRLNYARTGDPNKAAA